MMFSHLLKSEIANKGLTILDQLHRPSVQLVKIIRCMKTGLPSQTRASGHRSDRLRVFHFFGDRVGVVQAEVTKTAKFLSYSKI